MKLTKQEMFDRAYRGLASQWWKRAFGPSGCVYQTDDGRRCAWGWVDMSLDRSHRGGVERLRDRKVGLAGELPDDLFQFADELQVCHDACCNVDLHDHFDRLASDHGLTIPELP